MVFKALFYPTALCKTSSHNKAPVHTSSPMLVMPLGDALLTSVQWRTPDISADPFLEQVLTFRYHTAPRAPLDSLRRVVCTLWRNCTLNSSIVPSRNYYY
ncbi:hypothetical protein Y032_0252g240 [Ancylostoma ceylanicum]|uniref:Uncharacterized protein n=1 Tax=Ancylostoma ceylanicum TaxID=53326 RepID=A0A016SCY3_9BILA|nr:hypothetical protein Y032_0252g240 [Ancylostoma ceylanicum]